MVTGVERIALERRRQITVEGYTPDHDAEHNSGDLLRAAESYVLTVLDPQWWAPSTGNAYVPVGWPWDSECWKPSDDPIRNLEKAGALIAAEIDRLVAT